MLLAYSPSLLSYLWTRDSGILFGLGNESKEFISPW